MVTVNGTEKRSYSYPAAKAQLAGYKIPEGLKVSLWATDEYVEEPDRIGIRRMGPHLYMLYHTDREGKVNYKQGYKNYRTANYYVVQLVAAISEGCMPVWNAAMQA